jgi:hypothetical protein
VRKHQRKATTASGDQSVSHEVVVDEHPDPRMLDQARKAEEVIALVCGFTGGGQGAPATPRPHEADVNGVQTDPSQPAVPADEEGRELSVEALQARTARLADLLARSRRGPT